MVDSFSPESFYDSAREFALTALGVRLHRRGNQPGILGVRAGRVVSGPVRAAGLQLLHLHRRLRDLGRRDVRQHGCEKAVSLVSCSLRPNIGYSRPLSLE